MARLVYKLVGQKRSSTSSLGYYARGDMNGKMESLQPLSYSRSLPLYHRIMEFNSKTQRYEPRRVAYSPTEKSIYVDEWVDPKSKPIKPRFKEGFLIVDLKKQQALADLLDILDINGSKEGRDEATPIKFIQLNKDKQATEELKYQERVAKEMVLFWELPTEKLEAIANAVGIETLMASDSIWKHRLFMWAQSHLDEFMKQTKNPDLDYIDTVTRARNLGLIEFRENTWFRKFGDKEPMPIMKVSHVKNEFIELANKLINDPPLERSLSNDIAEKEGKSNRTIDETIGEVDMNEISAEALLELAQSKKVVKYVTGVGYEILLTGRKVGDGRSKKDAVGAIEADADLREAIVKGLNMV